MAGIQSLMQGQQGPVPGQAPQQPMPGMMPQQGAATPAAMVGPLSQMHMQQLVQLMLNPRPDGPPLYAVISAISEQQKKAQAQEAVQRQLAMSQGQQAAQQPPIAQQLVAKAMQPTQMAAHGGIMHGYAGGGAVAFQSGGPVQKFQYGAGPRGVMAQPPMLTSIDGLPIYAPGPDKAPGETEAEYQARKQKEAAEADEVSNRPLRRLYRYLAEKIREPSPVAQMRTPAAQTAAPAAAAQAEAPSARPDIPRFTSQELERFVKTPTPAPSPAPGAPEPQKRQTAAAPKPGISGLVGPEIDPYTLEARQAAGEYQTALQKATQLTPEQIAARQKIDEAMTGRKKFIGTEEQRRESLAEKRLQEALERSRVKPLEDITFIGQMLEGMKGAKRFGEGLAGLASGAGKAQAGREAALRAAEEKYDLSRNDIFKLQDARNQLDMDEAKLAEARATGDADKINAAAANVARSKMDLAKLQSDIQDRALGRRLEREKIDVEREKVLAALEGTRAGREASAEQRLMGQLGRLDQFKLEEIRKLEADHVKDPKYRMVYALASTGAQLTPDQEAQFRAANADLAAKRKRVSDAIDQRVSQIESRLGYSSMTGADLQQWGEPTIKKGG